MYKTEDFNKVFVELFDNDNFGEDSKELLKDVVIAGAEYTKTRALFNLYSREERALFTSIDSERTRQHDLFISNLNILLRNHVKTDGGDLPNLRNILRIGSDDFDRKYIGDFAGYMTERLAYNNR